MRIVTLFLLLFSIQTFGSDVILRRALPQQYTNEEVAHIQSLTLRGTDADPVLNQGSLINAYAAFVNSGEYNIHEVTTHYHDGYLVAVRIDVLPFSGAGNKLRLYIQVATESGTSSEDDNEHHRAMAQHLLKNEPAMVPIETAVGYDGIQIDPSAIPRVPLCVEIFYFKPSWDDDRSPVSSLLKGNSDVSR